MAPHPPVGVGRWCVATASETLLGTTFQTVILTKNSR